MRATGKLGTSARLFLVLAFIVVTSPGIRAQNGIVGSLSALGAVQLRGIPVSGEGTLFAGDRIETSGEAYARIFLTDGPQLELWTDTDVRVDRDASGVRVSMNAGRLALSSTGSSLPVTVSVESLRIEAPPGARAEIAFLAPNTLTVLALQDTLTVTEQEEDQSETVPEGGQVIIDLDAEIEPGETATTEDAAGESGPSSTKKWVLIGAAAGGGAGAAIVLAGREKDSASPSQP